MADSPDSEGAVEPGSETTTGENTGATGGITAADGGATETGHQDTVFFDPSDVPEELKGVFKSMQSAYTKKTQALSEQRKKVEAYDQFLSDPHGTMQSLAKQLGYKLDRPDQRDSAGEGDWQPNSWDDVFSRAKQEVLREMQPLLNEVQKVKKTHIEQVLDTEVPEWRQYEDEMMDALKKHPSLANEPAVLARVALPNEVIEGKAYQRALKKLEQKGKSQQTSKGSSTQKTPPLGSNKNLTFQESFELAKKQAAAQS